MVFKSLSVSEAINLQDTLHLSSTLTDSTVQKHPKYKDSESEKSEVRIEGGK